MFEICASIVFLVANVVEVCLGEDPVSKSSSELLKTEFDYIRIRCPVDLHPLHMDFIRLNSDVQNQKAVTCLIKYLMENKDEGYAWSSLGDLYQLQSRSNHADICFKQAAQLDGSFTSFVRGWHFIGPFVVGKGEVDGDPVEHFGGIQNISGTRFANRFKFYSELARNGEVTWLTYRIREKVYVSITHTTNWGELVNSLGSVGIAEWQGWVVGEFAVNVNNLEISLRCLGVHSVLVDGLPLVGDIYGREQFWFPVSVGRGMHTIYARVRAKGTLHFRCDIEKSPSQSFRVLKPSFIPDVYEGRIFSRYFTLTIANLHSTKWLKFKKFTVLKFLPEVPGVKVKLKEDKLFAIAPGQTRPIILELVADELAIDNSFTRVHLTVGIVTSFGSTDAAISFRCRKTRQSFLFTFIDHDGSLQHGAAIHPLSPCAEKLCPVVLTLHGTTVPPQDQADSYKRMVDGEYVFGVEKAWILAPTRHGAHNWEGPGALTALTALKEFSRMTHSFDWIEQKASSEFIIFAGHSMGGHGAWHLATHFPDMALAVVSLAGWIKKEEYGDSNLFFRHDISNSHVPPRVKSILEDCITENEADRHVSNLKGISVLMRIGADDRTIHPYFNRRMYRILKQERINVTYVELKGKEHWWWDTNEPNDGGCVNDEQIRDFINIHAGIPYIPTFPETGYCEKTDVGDVVCKPTPTPYEFSENFTLSVTNTAFMGSMRGIRIMQQIVPHQLSNIHVTLFRYNVDRIYLTTENVKVFHIKDTGYRSLIWPGSYLEVDSSTFDFEHVADVSQSGICFCLDETDSVSWSLCDICVDMEGQKLRGPATIGPARRIAESKFIIVAGSQSSNEALNKALQTFAIYIANLFFLTSDTLAYVVLDRDLPEDVADEHNLVIIGGPDQNLFAQTFIDEVPLKVLNGSISIGKCRFKDYRTGALFLAPHANHHRLALVLLGNSLDGLKDVVSLAAPTIPPMTRSPFSNMIPDFIVTGPTFGLHGPGGYGCTGFWDGRWGIRPELISCALCL